MSSSIETLSTASAEAVSAVGASVLSVDARSRMPSSGIVWSPDGLVITAAHTVRREEGIRLRLQGGEWLPAELIGHDPTTDLALLRIDEAGLPLVLPEWEDEAELAVGQLALVLGRPGRSIRASFGIVSALEDAWRTRAGGQIDRYLQADLVMYPGFSGGPLVGAGGRIIGMTSSGIMRGAAVALTRSTVDRIAGTLLEHGRVGHGYLGVSIQEAQLPARLAQATGQESGLIIVGLEPDGPADSGGLLLGDTLLSLDREPLLAVEDLSRALAGRAGGNALLELVRGNSATELQLSLGER